MKHTLLGGIIIATCFTASAQAQPVKDTSFTVYSAYVKAKKNYPQISISQTSRTPIIQIDSNITYCQRGPHTLQLDVFYPVSNKKKSYPAVLLLHGGGWKSGDRSQQEPMAAYLASHGFVAIDVTYRLSGEAQYPAAVYDVKAAISWVRANARNYKIESHKIALLGCSAGGQLAALIATTNGNKAFEDTLCHAGYSSDVQALIDIDGILAFIHPESGEGDERKGASAATLWLGGNKEDQYARWQEASPLNHVSKTTPPVLFINSEVNRMHAGRNDMIRKLDSLHIYSEVHTMDAPHTFWLFHPWFEPMMSYINNFLDKIFNNRKLNVMY